MPDDIRKTPPESPTGLEDGLRGKVTGVTRIGPRAFGIGFIVIFGLLLAILYGVNHQSTVKPAPPIAAVAPAAAPSDSHFGDSIPAVPSQIPATDPPPILTNPVPDVANSEPKNTAAPAAAAPAGPSPEELRERAEEAAREQALADAEAKRRALLLAARKSPILTGSGANQLGGVGSTTPGQPVQVAFAGNGTGSSVDGVPASYQAPGGEGSGSGGGFVGNGTSGAAAAGATGAGGAAGASGAGAGSGVGGGGTAGNALLGQQVAQAGGNTTVATNGGGSFMNGPFGQYNIPGAAVNIPRGGTASDFLQSSRFGYISPFELVASSVIPAELVGSINSDLPGLVTGLIREDVYDSKTGKYLLIPRGSRLIGEYNNTVNFGQSRVSVAWRRLIFPDTTSINLLEMPATDVEGSSGLAGTVDNHYGKIIGAALLTSVLAAGLAVAAPQQQNVLLTPNASQEATASIQQNVTNLGTQLIQRDLSIPPTLQIPKGYPFLVLVDRDIVFPGPYTPR